MSEAFETGNAFDQDYGVVSAEHAKEASEANNIPDGWYLIRIHKHSLVPDSEKKDKRIYRAGVDTGETRPHPYIGFRLVKTTFDVYTGGASPRKSTTFVSPDKVLLDNKMQMPSVLGGQIAKATDMVGKSFRDTLDKAMTVELFARIGGGYFNEITERRPNNLKGA